MVTGAGASVRALARSSAKVGSVSGPSAGGVILAVTSVVARRRAALSIRKRRAAEKINSMSQESSRPSWSRRAWIQSSIAPEASSSSGVESPRSTDMLASKPHELSPSHTPQSSIAPDTQHRPPASTTPVLGQHTPRGSTNVPSPSHTPQPSTTPEAQHSPSLSRAAAWPFSSQQRPSGPTTPLLQHSPAASSMAPSTGQSNEISQRSPSNLSGQSQTCVSLKQAPARQYVSSSQTLTTGQEKRLHGVLLGGGLAVQAETACGVPPSP
mmetsp:Transcript_64194/g.155212  ORF Transcript_64194/g.155212 Transcript_64194/m.155212 type:complete len:268 (-) Transcript_64194:3034-3837(-)